MNVCTTLARMQYSIIFHSYSYKYIYSNVNDKVIEIKSTVGNQSVMNNVCKTNRNSVYRIILSYGINGTYSRRAQ